MLMLGLGETTRGVDQFWEFHSSIVSPTGSAASCILIRSRDTVSFLLEQ